MHRLSLTLIGAVLALSLAVVISPARAGWTAQTAPNSNNLKGVYFVDATTGYAVGSSGTIHKTTDGGSNWTALTSGTGAALYAVHFPVDATTGYAVGSSGMVRKTTNGGTGWTNVQDGSETNSLLGVSFLDNNTGYAVGNSGTILKTTDGGSNWTRQTSGTTSSIQGVYFVDASTGYVVGSDGVILKTTNGGTGWTDVQDPAENNTLVYVQFPVDATTGWAVGWAGTILKTTDGGSNWTSQSGATEYVRAISFPADDKLGYAVGNNGEGIKTTDGGTNWNTEATGTTEWLRGVHFPDATTGYAVGNNGTILKLTEPQAFTLSDHDAGQQPDAFTESGGETEAELFGFTLDPGGSTVTVTELIVSLSDIAGLTDSDWSLVDIFVDSDDNGNIDPGETTTVGGAGSVDQAAGRITFSSSFDVSAATNYILRADFGSLSDADTVTIELSSSYITASLTVSGSTTSLIHREGCFYAESYQAWSATDPDTWETKDLSSAPFNVPPNSVVEVAVRNDRSDAQRYGGVRAAGSGIDRRFLLHEAESGGVDVVVMHVQADSSSQIEHYSDATGSVDFVLLGYWDCGTYVEAIELFNAGASASWQPQDLNSYGVGSGQVAEVVMVNTNSASQWEAGVRTNGSSLERRLDLHEPESGGVDTATMCVTADATANATIEIYAEDDVNIDFYLVGYWTTPPRTYTQAFSAIGSPVGSATWEDADLTTFGVPADAVAEITLANTDPNAQHNMGVRANNTTLARLLKLQEAEAGGADLGRMHVTADGASIIDFYQENVSAPHTFYLTGYWSTASAPPKIVRWREVDPN